MYRKFIYYIKRLTPLWLKYSLYYLYVLAIFLFANRVKDSINLCLAGALSKSRKIIYGGRVKLLHLKEAFGNSSHRFNIIYVVSSTITPYLKIWVKLAKMFKVKIVWNQNGVAWPGWAGDKVENLNQELKLIHQADYVIYQSEFCQKSANIYLGEYKGDHSVIYNCVDTEHYKPGIKNTKLLVLLAMGTHVDRERIIIPLKALPILRQNKLDIKFKIIGRLLWPNGETEVKNLIKELDIGELVEVDSKGFTQKQAPEIMRLANILIHIKYNDPCPGIVIEAMACGLPVISSRSGGLPELVKAGAGILIDVPQSYEKMHYPTPEEVAAAVMKISPNLQSYSDQARQNAVDNFGKTDWLEKHRQIFQKVLLK